MSRFPVSVVTTSVKLRIAEITLTTLTKFEKWEGSVQVNGFVAALKRCWVKQDLNKENVPGRLVRGRRLKTISSF